MYYISCPRCDSVIVLKFKIDHCLECNNQDLVIEYLNSYEYDLDLEIESLQGDVND